MTLDDDGSSILLQARYLRDKAEIWDFEKMRREIHERTEFLKVTGIIMIVGGAVDIIAGVIGVLGVRALVLLLESVSGTGLLYAATG